MIKSGRELKWYWEVKKIQERRNLESSIAFILFMLVLFTIAGTIDGGVR